MNDRDAGAVLRAIDRRDFLRSAGLSGASYPRGIDADGRTTFHLRNWLLFPPRLHAVTTINDSVPGKGVLDFA